MSQILVTKPGVLNQRDRAALRKAGVVCVEADDPSDVKLITADGAEMRSGDLFLAAMRGANYDASSRSAFTKALANLAELRWAELEKVSMKDSQC